MSLDYPSHIFGLAAGPPSSPLAVRDGLRPIPAFPAASFNHLGDGFWERRRLGEALACYQEAVRLGGDPAARAERRWMAWMMLGRFENAWRESDRLERLHRMAHGPAAHCHAWDGRPLDGRDVLVRCAHGLGDTIQFVRYLPLLRPRCRSLTLQAQRELWPVLQGLGADRIVPSWEVLPEDVTCDAEIEIMELPYAFRSAPATLPAQAPYLHVPAEGVEAVRNALKNEKRFKVGLVWASSSWNAMRSVPLELFEPLTRMSGVALFNLQHGPERDKFPGIADGPVRDLQSSICNLPFMNPQSAIRNPQSGSEAGEDARAPSMIDTAALMLNMDLVLTPDTLAAHLAGALGRPVWVMLLHQADWRWMIGRDDSPWYPTMRLYRQPVPGDWAGCVGRMFSDLGARFL